MNIRQRLGKLEARQHGNVYPWLVLLISGRSDDEIIGLSGVPFERGDGESWPQYHDRAEQWAKGRCALAIARYRGDD